MVHTLSRLRAHVDALCALAAPFAQVVARCGYPAPRVSAPGYETLLRTIVGQQVSVAAAASVWTRLESALGAGCPPDVLMHADDAALRACGLSRQKAGYARSLAGLVTGGALDLDALPDEDEAAIALLTAVKGIGRWSAEIYLLFAEGRDDIWPAGDLAVQIEVGRIFALPERPAERTVRAMADAWRPHRSAAALLSWHSYNSSVI